MLRPSLAGKFGVLVACGVVSFLTVAHWISPGRTEATISVRDLQPPAQYVSGMTKFLDREEDGSTRFGKGADGMSPLHGTGVWGFYISAIDQDPWRSQLTAQQANERTGASWPPLPLHGPILGAPEFQHRPLELYVAIDVLPNLPWAEFDLRALQESATGSLNVPGDPCPYGQGCLEYTRTPPGTDSLTETEHLWRWRIGRVVVSVSALGSLDWPTDTVTPLIGYYVTALGQTKGINDNPAVQPTPPATRNSRHASRYACTRLGSTHSGRGKWQV